MAFSTAELQQQVQALTASLPAESKGAMVATVDSTGRFKVVMAGKINEHWTVIAEVKKQPGQQIAAEGGVILHW